MRINPLDVLLAVERNRKYIPDDLYESFVRDVEKAFGVKWPID